MSAKPYTDAEIAEIRGYAIPPLDEMRANGFKPELYPGMDHPLEQERWLATVDALKSRLAAAEAECRAREEVQARLIRERNAAEAEAERARGLLGEALIALTTMRGFAGLAVRIERHLASRPEGEVRHGE